MDDINTKLLNVYCANYKRTLYYNEGDSTLPTAPTAASEDKFKQLVNSNTYTCFARGNKTCPFEEFLNSGLVAKYNSGKSLSIQKLTNCYKPSPDTVTLLDCKELAPDHYGLPVFDIKMKGVKYTEGLVHLLNYSTVLPPFNIENITLFIPDGDEQVEKIVSVSIEGEKDYDYQNNPITKVNCQHAKQDKTSRVFKDEHIINLKHFKGWILDIVVTYNHPGTIRHPRKLSAIKRQDHIISDEEAELFFNIMFNRRVNFEAECQKILDEKERVEQEQLARTAERTMDKEEDALEDLKKQVIAARGQCMMLHAAIIELITKLKNSKLITNPTNYRKFKSHLNLIVEKAKELPRDFKSEIIRQLTPGSSGHKIFNRAANIAAKELNESAAKQPACREYTSDDDEEIDKMMNYDGGARKIRKRRKTKRRKNKKLKKTYKKRRSTKNKRR